MYGQTRGVSGIGQQPRASIRRLVRNLMRGTGDVMFSPPLPALYTNMDLFQARSTLFRTVKHQDTELLPYTSVLDDLRATGITPNRHLDDVRSDSTEHGSELGRQ